MIKNKQKQQVTAIEEAYERGLALEKSGQFTQAAAAYAKVLALDGSDMPGVSMRLAAMGQGPVPKTAPKAYISALFDQYADVFDMILVDNLDYDVPNLLAKAVAARCPGRRFASMLDCGCGTGLAAEAFEAMTDKRAGIDLSANMVEIAAERQLYQKLFTGDILRFLRENASPRQKGSGQNWDLIIAADVLPYIGAVEEFFSLVGGALAAGGIFAFSIEDLERILPAARRGNSAAHGRAEGFAVGPHQRFAHSRAYIAAQLAQAGLELLESADITVRQEQNSPVPGQIFLCGKHG